MHLMLTSGRITLAELDRADRIEERRELLRRAHAMRAGRAVRVQYPRHWTAMADTTTPTPPRPARRTAA